MHGETVKFTVKNCSYKFCISPLMFHFILILMVETLLHVCLWSLMLLMMTIMT